ncbi:hypothetical protein L6452_28007 [Arctium lappa]|uniref:Uncharacterized protein n=1 Tax=Arctium lappa TaxID=4217 RepID=A0ACB8ZX39_ARCLA|nr:hypothetical protein L6452_28007 [Arctium lappa]
MDSVNQPALTSNMTRLACTFTKFQYAQSSYDAEGILLADQIMVSKLKSLSEFKQSFLKKHLDDDYLETTHLLAEIQEQKNLLQMYEITGKKLDNQSKLKDSEIIFLKEKLDEANRENKSIEKRLNSSGPLSPHQKLRFPSLDDFVSSLREAHDW